MKLKNDMLLSFVSGFLPSSGAWLIIDAHPFYSFLLKVLSAVLIGAVGGLAGLIMKDVYKQYLRKYFINKKRKR